MIRMMPICWSISKHALCAVSLLLLAVSCAGRDESTHGDRLFKQGRYDEAVEIYEQALLEKPRSEKFLQKLQMAKLRASERHLEQGTLALKEQRLFEARTEFQTALRYNPQLAAASGSLAATEEIIENITAGIHAAEALMEERKWFEAIDRLKPLRKYKTEFPEAETLYIKAFDTAFNMMMEDGMAAYEKKDFTLALSLFSKALGLKPKDTRASGMVKAARNQTAALEYCAQGTALLDAGDYREAVQKYQSALNLIPGHVGAAQGLQAAKEYGARALLAQGTKAFEEKRNIDALTALDEAARLLPDYPGLAEARSKVKRAVADILFANGETHEDAGRLASAHVFYRLVRLLVVDYPGLEKKLGKTGERIKEASSYDSTLTFTGNNKLQADFYNTLKGQLDSDVIHVLSASEAEAVKQLNPDYKPDGILAVNIGSVRVKRTVARREKRSVRYVSDSRTVFNEEHDSLQDELDRYRRNMESAKAKADDQRRKVRRLRRERDRARDEWKAAAEDDPKKDKSRRKYIRLRDETNRAERRLNKLVREYDSWRHQVKEVEKRLAGTPRHVKEDVYSTHYYDVVTNKITASGKAMYSLTDNLAGGLLLSGRVETDNQQEDKVVEKFKPAGVAVDPDELPSKRTMRSNAEDDLVDDLAKKVAADIRRFPLRYLRKAEAAKKAGKADMTADYYSLYLFTTRTLGLKRGMPRLTEVDAIIRSRTGYSVAGNTYDLASLKRVMPQFMETFEKKMERDNEIPEDKPETPSVPDKDKTSEDKPEAGEKTPPEPEPEGPSNADDHK